MRRIVPPVVVIVSSWRVKSNSISTTYHSGRLQFDYTAFDPVARVSVETPVLAVRADAPWKTLQDFMEYAKTHPDKVRIGFPGNDVDIGREQLMERKHESEVAGVAAAALEQMIGAAMERVWDGESWCNQRNSHGSPLTS